MNKLKDYYYLAKPGIIRGNLFSAIAGFLFACRWKVDWSLFVATLLGIAFVIASGCVFNNYLDRSIDRKMKRTRNRALPSGRISGNAALSYGTLLGLIGLGLLWRFVNPLTAAIGAFGLFAYVIWYGFEKRRSPLGTLVGTISGALPPVAGYTAVTNQVDGAALILFAILVFWQMPHFYGIAMYRVKDYTKAGIPVLPVVSGMAVTKRQTLWYVVGFAIASAALPVFGYVGITYLTVALLLGAYWMYLGLKDYHTNDDVAWGRKMFLFSLASLLIISIMIPLGTVLP